METNKQAQAPVERHMFTPEELQRIEKQLELQTDREELIGWMDNYSYFFADWSIIINEAVHERITKKQQLNVGCEKEWEMLSNLSFLFTKIAYFSGMLSDWHEELTLGKKLTEEMIKQGHP